jgi:hypothetical protein
VEPAVIVIPTTVELAPVDDSVLIVFPVIFIVVTAEDPPVIPVTVPPVPDETSDVMLLPE